MYKKSITKIILLAAVLLLTCANQNAMEDRQRTDTIPELILINTIKIDGHICNPHQHKMNYFLIFKNETKTIEIWDKQHNKIDTITLTQIANVIQKSRLLDQDEKNHLTEEEIIKSMSWTYINNSFGKEEIWVRMDCSSYIIRYCPHEKRFTEIHFKNIPSIPFTIKEQPLELKTIIPNWHEKYHLYSRCFYFGKNSNLMAIRATTKKDRKKEIILIDLEALKPIAQYTFPQGTPDYESETTLHLSKDKHEIILVADIDEKMWIFKNPLAKQSEENIDEQEKRNYILGQKCPKSKDEEKLVVNINGIKIPVDRTLLLLG